MSYAESPVETIKKFDKVPAWKKESLEVLTADFLSLGSESNLFLNPSFYEERDGKLFDPRRNKPVAGTANGDTVEEGVIKQIEDWFISQDSGVAVWISPRKESTNTHPGYPEEQLTIYRIGYELLDLKTFKTKKILFFTSHQFNCEFKNPENLRKFIFTEGDHEEVVFEIINWLKSVSKKNVQTEIQNLDIRRNEAEYYALQYKSGVPIETITYEMIVSGFIGQNPIGCRLNPIAFSNMTGPVFGYTQTLTIEDWHPGVCNNCGRETVVGPCSICKSCADKMPAT